MPRSPATTPKTEAQKIVAEGWVGHVRHEKIWRRPGEQPRHDNGATGGPKRGDGVACVEFPGEFLKDKDSSGERRIERGGKSGARARREQRQAVGGIPAKGFPEQVRQGRAHLDAWPLAAKREARADRQHAAEEFDRQQNQRRWRQLAVEHRLNVGNAAARRILAETPHEPSAERGRRGRRRDQEAAAEERLILPPYGQGKAEMIRFAERQPEQAAYKSGARPGDAGQHGQRNQAWTNENPRRRLNIRTEAPEPHLFRRFLARRVFLDFIEARAGARKICFDHKIVGTADLDEMFDTVAANDEKLPLPV